MSEIFVVLAGNDHKGEFLVGAFSTAILAGDEAHRLSHPKAGITGEPSDGYTVYRVTIDAQDDYDAVANFRSGFGCESCRKLAGVSTSCILTHRRR